MMLIETDYRKLGYCDSLKNRSVSLTFKYYQMKIKELSRISPKILSSICEVVKE